MPVVPPRPRGPHLAALLAFKTDAAADELCAPTGAFSRQIRALEDSAGTALFESQSRLARLNDPADRASGGDISGKMMNVFWRSSFVGDQSGASAEKQPEACLASHWYRNVSVEL
ncbi:LysR family transcriptional regulator [Aliiruegeria lutimaris]|uniref:Regulatory helix-turn-helix protein, lysR family n=1 Tax=Aliiruegeria lutimaris TaxID=571298 RepID=A0A1G8IMS2_9RHOB|nr:LysR family transcriptional regulator [Aliiruegeria lutimaris]SDI20259.1 regulatory helix-turn-helix protein, lysR family [Aliiruegeria lutimaris]